MKYFSVVLTWHWRWQRGPHCRIALLVATPSAAGRWAGWAAWGPASPCCWSAGTRSRPAASAAHCSWNTDTNRTAASQRAIISSKSQRNTRAKYHAFLLKRVTWRKTEVVTYSELTSGKGQEGPWLGQISRPPSTDTFKLRIRQGVTRAAEVFRFSATHCAKLVVSQANWRQKQTDMTFKVGQCFSDIKLLLWRRWPYFHLAILLLLFTVILAHLCKAFILIICILHVPHVWHQGYTKYPNLISEYIIFFLTLYISAVKWLKLLIKLLWINLD